MKKRNYFTAIILLIIITSCATQKNIKERLVLTEDYKRVYFTKCLYYGFNNSKAIIEVLQQDNSVNSEYAQGKKNYKIIDSLAKITNEKIKKDSTVMFQTDDRGKPVLYGCLNGYTSKWLDSIAKTTYGLKIKKYKHYSEYK